MDLAARCSASLMLEALGASLGTLILPGVGTVVVQTLASLVPWFYP
jgi:hypothetical protein